MKKLITLLLLSLGCQFCTFAQDTTFYDPFYSGNILFSVGNKFGLLNKNKKIIIQAQYSEIIDAENNLVKVTLNNKVGFIDSLNKVIIPFMYDMDTNNCIGSRGIESYDIEENGRVSKIEYVVSVDKNHTNFSEGLCVVIKNGKYGFIDTTGSTIIPFQYDGADNFSNGIAIVKVNNQYGAINHTGTFVIPCIYDYLVVDENEGIFARINGEAYIINYEDKKLSKWEPSY